MRKLHQRTRRHHALKARLACAFFAEHFPRGGRRPLIAYLPPLRLAVMEPQNDAICAKAGDPCRSLNEAPRGYLVAGVVVCCHP